ncbi:uncharacterized protein LOC106089997 [Stomoxys calcitrans]|uniref:uncharacterized protein LOC106089997 n=1 Tax=Stomoxys calcitrans TaxID=35570 RepID=UPI0027E2F8DA|nr:uncharacterized protein LOC106089997 [Stomoxys calcitrans]
MFDINHKRWISVFIWQVSYVILKHSHYAAAECNVCQSNQAACINTTSYYLCFGGDTPVMDELYHCQNGFDCTDLNAICVQSSSQRRPSCGDTSLCGLCSAHRNHVFACMSRTTFRMCYGALRPIGPTGYCPEGYVCDAKSNTVCVPQNLANEVTCDMVAEEEGNGNGGGQTPTTTTTTTTTPPSTGEGGENETTSTPKPNENLTAQQVCEQINQIGLYETSPTDPYCKRYVHCYKANGSIKGMEYLCSSGAYYHIQQKKCVFNKPSYCL